VDRAAQGRTYNGDSEGVGGVIGLGNGVEFEEAFNHFLDLTLVC
jgi:hypothetical protein